MVGMRNEEKAALIRKKESKQQQTEEQWQFQLKMYIGTLKESTILNHKKVNTY